MLVLRAEGLSTKEVAGRLRIAEGTVRNHIRHAYLKLEASNLIIALRALGWVDVRNVS